MSTGIQARRAEAMVLAPTEELNIPGLEDYLPETLEGMVLTKGDTLPLIIMGKKVDFLFIDGNHFYEPATEDFINYSRFVRDDGWIAFHDIRDKLCGVRQFWNEIRAYYDHWEFCLQEQPDEIKKSSKPETLMNGIGLLRWRGNT
jgi:hypothetical protein